MLHLKGRSDVPAVLEIAKELGVRVPWAGRCAFYWLFPHPVSVELLWILRKILTTWLCVSIPGRSGSAVSEVWMWPCSWITTHTALERLLVNIFEYLYGGLTPWCHRALAEDFFRILQAALCKVCGFFAKAYIQKTNIKNRHIQNLLNKRA